MQMSASAHFNNGGESSAAVRNDNLRGTYLEKLPPELISRIIAMQVSPIPRPPPMQEGFALGIANHLSINEYSRFDQRVRKVGQMRVLANYRRPAFMGRHALGSNPDTWRDHTDVEHMPNMAEVTNSFNWQHVDHPSVSRRSWGYFQ